MKYIVLLLSPQAQAVLSLALASLLLCSCRHDASNECKVTAEMALEGVSNYCHEEYDWNIAEEKPNIMDIEMGEETDSTYQVVFQSYTGAKVFFYVDKASGQTRIEEYVPAIDIRSDAGSIELFDYLEKKE